MQGRRRTASCSAKFLSRVLEHLRPAPLYYVGNTNNFKTCFAACLGAWPCPFHQNGVFGRGGGGGRREQYFFGTWENSEAAWIRQEGHVAAILPHSLASLTLCSLLSAGPPGRRGKPGRRGEPGKHRLSPASLLGTPRVSLGWMGAFR